ncbi:Hsp20/alpha crystallin family protein [Streptomyces sparsogenes]|nr:Hsp20/alpha crystallin family protein [Streptomyces sparsogenes]
MSMPVRRTGNEGAMERRRGWARSPLAEFDDLLNQMGGLLESTVGGGLPGMGLVAWTPSADVSESDEGYHLQIELPGVSRNEVDVEVSGQELAISGEIRERERKGVVRRSTRRTGHFEYRMRLPGEVNTEGVKASMSEGVLSIDVPKAETTKPRHIEITEAGESGGG